MKKRALNIAIVAPEKDAYSETFIKAHRDLINGNIKYYYGGAFPTHINDKKINGELSLLISFIKERIDVVLAEYGITGANIVDVCNTLHIPLIVSCHGFDVSNTKILHDYQFAYKKMFHYASYILVVSKKMFKQLQTLGCPTEKIILNTYGPKDDFLDIVPSFSEQSCIAVGRFVDKKAPYYTILAFAKVIQKYPKAKLYFAGDGLLLETCQNLAKTLNISKNIKFLGIINPAQYQLLLKKCCCFTQHSITASNGDSEGTPLSILEASAAGLPIVSTYHAGIPDIVINNKTGFLEKEHNVDSIANDICRLLSNKNLAREMGKQGKLYISKHFNMRKHIKKIDECLFNSYIEYQSKNKKILLSIATFCLHRMRNFFKRIVFSIILKVRILMKKICQK